MADWLFGRCTSTVYGAEVFDIAPLPRVQANIDAEDTYQGGLHVGLDGSGTMDTIVDRFGRPVSKRHWQLVLHPLATLAQWWPVLRQRRTWRGPWLLFDQSQPNLLTADQRLMRGWSDNASAPITPRADGAIRMGTASPSNTARSNTGAAGIIPVQAATQYFMGCTAYGPAAWSLGILVNWFTAANVFISTTTVAVQNVAASIGDVPYLDGTVTASRIGGTLTSPNGAGLAQLQFTCSVNPVTVSDPVMLPGPADPGPAMFVVAVGKLPEPHLQQGTLPLSIEFTEL